jgi:hypothetical protein
VASIEIDPQYESWVQDNVVKRFESLGIAVTPTAQQALAFLLQAQVKKLNAKNPEEVLQQAQKLIVPILRGHAARYPKQTLTVNRALHLLVDANTFLHFFPTGTTMEVIRTKDRSFREFDFSDQDLEKEGQH